MPAFSQRGDGERGGAGLANTVEPPERAWPPPLAVLPGGADSQRAGLITTPITAGLGATVAGALGLTPQEGLGWRAW